MQKEPCSSRQVSKINFFCFKNFCFSSDNSLKNLSWDSGLRYKYSDTHNLYSYDITNDFDSKDQNLYAYTLQPVNYEISEAEQRQAQLAIWRSTNKISTKSWIIMAVVAVLSIVGINDVGYS